MTPPLPAAPPRKPDDELKWGEYMENGPRDGRIRSLPDLLRTDKGRRALFFLIKKIIRENELADAMRTDTQGFSGG